MPRMIRRPETIALLLGVLCLPLSSSDAAGAWVKIWDVQNVQVATLGSSGGLSPRDFNADGTLEFASFGMLTSTGAPTYGLRIIDLSGGAVEYEEPQSASGEGLVGIVAVDLDRDGILELIVQWTSHLECLKWNGAPAARIKHEVER